MKYGYDGVEEKELIYNYTINDNKIIITYLDGSSEEIPLTRENEKELLNKMIEQAIERNNSSALSLAKRERNWNCFQGILTALMMCANGGIVSLSDDIVANTFCGIACISAGLCTIGYGMSYKFSKDEVEELKKYDIYLSIRKRLEASAELVFKGVKMQEALTINTLDNYSLKDIKKIRKNLEIIRYCPEFSNDSSKSHTLTKRISQ